MLERGPRFFFSPLGREAQGTGIAVVHYCLRRALRTCCFQPLYEAADTLKGQFDLLDRACVTGAYIAGATWTKGVAGNHRHLFFDQQLLGKSLAAETKVAY